jgi:hypothetical protein
MTATASSITAHRIDGTATFLIAHLILRLFITDAEAEKSVIYGRRQTGFIEAKSPQFNIGLNCTTLQFVLTSFGHRGNELNRTLTCQVSCASLWRALNSQPVVGTLRASGHGYRLAWIVIREKWRLCAGLECEERLGNYCLWEESTPLLKEILR